MTEADHLLIQTDDTEKVAYTHPLNQRLSVDLSHTGRVVGVHRSDGPVTLLDLIAVIEGVPYPEVPPESIQLGIKYVFRTTEQYVGRHIAHKWQWDQHHRALCGRPVITQEKALATFTRPPQRAWEKLPICRMCSRTYDRLLS